MYRKKYQIAGIKDASLKNSTINGIPAYLYSPDNKNYSDDLYKAYIEEIRKQITLKGIPDDYAKRYKKGESEKIANILNEDKIDYYNGIDFLFSNSEGPIPGFKALVEDQLANPTTNTNISDALAYSFGLPGQKSPREGKLGVSYYRPTIKDDKNINYYFTPFDKNLYIDENYKKEIEQYQHELIEKAYNFYKKNKLVPGKVIQDKWKNLQFGDLANYSLSLSKDIDYLSIFDILDFDPNKLYKSVLKKIPNKRFYPYLKIAGIPENKWEQFITDFKEGKSIQEILGYGPGLPIYDRIYKDPITGKTIKEIFKSYMFGGLSNNKNMKKYQPGGKKDYTHDVLPNGVPFVVAPYEEQQKYILLKQQENIQNIIGSKLETNQDNTRTIIPNKKAENATKVKIAKAEDKKKLTPSEYAVKYYTAPEEKIYQAPSEPSIIGKVWNAVNNPITTFSNSVNPALSAKANNPLNFAEYLLPTPKNIYHWAADPLQIITSGKTYTDIAKLAESTYQGNFLRTNESKNAALNTALNAFSILPIAKGSKQFINSRYYKTFVPGLDFHKKHLDEIKDNILYAKKHISKIGKPIKENFPIYTYKDYYDNYGKNLKNTILNYPKQFAYAIAPLITTPVIKAALSIPPIKKVAKDIGFILSTIDPSTVRSIYDIKDAIKLYSTKPRNLSIIEHLYNNLDGKFGRYFGKNLKNLGETHWTDLDSFKDHIHKSPLGMVFYPDKIRRKSVLSPIDKYAAPYLDLNEGDLVPTYKLEKSPSSMYFKRNRYPFEHYLLSYVKENTENELIKLNNLIKSKDISKEQLEKISKKILILNKLRNRFYRNESQLNTMFSQRKYDNYDKVITNLFKLSKYTKKYTKATNWSSLSDNFYFKDDIAGHMFKIGNNNIIVRDVWKFNPIDYGLKWSFTPKNTIIDYKRMFKPYIQSLLLNEVTTPVIFKYKFPLYKDKNSKL